MIIFNALMLPLMVLNLLGGLVAFVWLAILGEWRQIGFAAMVVVGGLTLLAFAMIPMMLLAAPAAACERRGKTGGMLFFAALSNLYTTALMTFWCFAVFLYYARAATEASLVPSLLMSYSVATGVWAHMASKDARTDEAASFSALFSVFVVQLAYVAVVLIGALWDLTFRDMAMIFAGLMLFGWVVETLIFVTQLRQRSDPLY